MWGNNPPQNHQQQPQMPGMPQQPGQTLGQQGGMANNLNNMGMMGQQGGMGGAGQMPPQMQMQQPPNPAAMNFQQGMHHQMQQPGQGGVAMPQMGGASQMQMQQPGQNNNSMMNQLGQGQNYTMATNQGMNQMAQPQNQAALMGLNQQQLFAGMQSALQAQQGGVPQNQPRPPSVQPNFRTHMMPNPSQQAHHPQPPQSQGAVGGPSTSAPQSQDQQTQLLLQQQNLIVQLQRQLQQQQGGRQSQPPSQPQHGGMMASAANLLQQQQGRQSQPPPQPGQPQGVGASATNMMQQQLMGNQARNHLQSPSTASLPGQSQQSQQRQTSAGSQFPPAMQSLMQRASSGSFGLAMPSGQGEQARQLQAQTLQAQQLQAQQLQALQSQRQLQANKKKQQEAREALLSRQRQQAKQKQEKEAQEALLSRQRQLQAMQRQRVQAQSQMAQQPTQQQRQTQMAQRQTSDGTPLVPSPTPTAGSAHKSGRKSTATPASMGSPQTTANQGPQNLKGVMDAMRRAASGAGSHAQSTGRNSTTPQPQAQARQTQGNQHAQLMAQMLQQQIARNNAAAAAAGDPAGGSGRGQVLTSRVKQFQVMQNLQQVQTQKSDGDSGSEAPTATANSAAKGQVPSQPGSTATQEETKPNVAAVQKVAAPVGAPETGRGENQPPPSVPSQPPSQKEPERRESFVSALSFGSGSQESIHGIVEPDPIAEGVNGVTGTPATVGGGKPQSFLEGHFAGGWQSNADLTDRRRINFHIIKVIERMRPDANRMSQNRLPLMAKKLEEHLYRSAHTKDEYIEPASLKRRLHLIARGVGMPKPGDDEGTSSSVAGSSRGGGEGGGSSQAIPVPVASNAQLQTPQTQMLLIQQRNQQAPAQGPAAQGPAAQAPAAQAPAQAQQQTQQAMSHANRQLSPLEIEDLPTDPLKPRSEKKKTMLIQQQRRLLLLRHASKCKGGGCQSKFCPQMMTLWKHMKKCRDKNCKVPHCLSSRCVLNHYRICKGKGKTENCAICAPVMTQLQQSGEGGGDDANDELDALALGSQGLDPLDAPTAEGSQAGGEGADGLASIEPLDFAMGERPTTAAQGVGLSIPQNRTADVPQSISMAQPKAPAQNIVALPPVAAAIGGAPQAQGQPAGLQDLQRKLNEKLQLLQQVQQQKANLFGQSQKLQQQLLATPAASEQLRKQRDILNQLNQQFLTQGSILQQEISEIQRIIGLQGASAHQNIGLSLGGQAQLPDISSNEAKPPALPQPTANFPLGENTTKRSSDAISATAGIAQSNDSRPSKMPKVGNGPSTLGNKVDSTAESVCSRGSSASGAAKDKGSSLIPTMPILAIEQHLDSLVRSDQLTPRHIARKCLPLVKKLMDHNHGWVFKDAVDPVELGIPDYFDIVEHPMDLTLVTNKLNDGAYKDLASFERDTKLVFQNAILFNGEDSDVGGMAREMLDVFAVELQNAMKGSNIAEPQKGVRDSCSLCGNYRRLFDPPAFFCSGSCGMQKIRRNATYYTDRLRQNQWCERCFARLTDDEPIQLDDGKQTRKAMLRQQKNDSTPEESWVQCDKCHNWQHQICALFNGSTKSSKSSNFTCPKCYIQERRTNAIMDVTDVPPNTTKNAGDLPHCHLSRSIEEGLLRTLSTEYEKVAGSRGCTVAQVEKAEGLCVRVVSSLEKKHKVRDEMAARYAKKGYPSEFKVTTKCIALFQKIHGVDVLLFGMYVYEYGHECPNPNQRRVYISYLDSVRYLEPSSYRTIAYQSVIVEYLRFVKQRGFHTAHIWSCPPAKGDEYIFHCHPTNQLTPSDDLLCAWYADTLEKAKGEGIVLETRTVYDEYFKEGAVNPKSGDMYDPTSLPYFDGDYIPGEIEKIIKDLNRDDSKREEAKLKGSGGIVGNAQKKQEGRRSGTRSNPGELVNQARDKVMNRLDLVLARMKRNFMVAQLLSDDFIQAVEKGEDVSSWTESTSKQKGKNPDVLECPEADGEPTDSKDGGSDDSVVSSTVWKITGDTKDHDPTMERECIDTRLQFLNYCQRNNYQFDELRRAKYTTMMLLSYLHSPRSEQEQFIRAYLEVCAHAATCGGPPGCSSTNCQRMKQLFQHIRSCDVTYKRGCKVCTRLFMLFTKHARDCNEDGCAIPFCAQIKERTQQLLKQQRMMDDRRRDALNDRLRLEEDSE